MPMKTITFDKIVRQICSLRGDPQAKTYVQVAGAAKIVLDQLNLFVFRSFFKSEVFTLDDSLTVPFPKDMEMFVKAGVRCGTKLRVLGYNSKVRGPSTVEACSCDEATPEDDVCEACTFHGVYLGNNFVGEYYGWRAPQNLSGEVNEDFENGRIVFSGGTDVAAGSQVVIEYKTSLEGDELMRLPAAAFLMIFHKTNELIASTFHPQMAHAHAIQFKKEYDAYKRITDQYTPMDIVKSFRGEYTSTPSR